MLDRWKRGWGVMWRTVVFQFWLGLFSVPTLLATKITYSAGFETSTFWPGMVTVTTILALINVPIAYCMASETTGFFEKADDK